ncbi:glycosyltransferase family 2 protein [Schaalia sp. Marseille-Q2122]|uniref:glycosyltransferase family 2 protein n=1 Tax=Schaalia sp. Marseille-Q2122 TaxID=2736604 RepID=UPI00158899F3|nr:glycosyltransferase family 2 protein [Schaalia sp. Marseille-Q2122]
MSTITDTCLVVPMYNEARVVGEVVSDLRTVFPNVVCVDDASEDGSVTQALKAGAVVLPHPVNLGQGAALQTGFEWVLRQPEYRYVITFDADGQHCLNDAVAMRERAEAHDLAFIFGSRFLHHPANTGIVKQWMLKTAAQVTRWRTGLDVTDAHNGLRLIRRDALAAIRLTQARMAHASEIVEQLAATALPWEEHSVTIRYTDYSRAKGQPLLNSVNILVDLAMR